MTMALTLIVTFLFVGTVYVDLNNAIHAAKKEIVKMREIRRDYYLERLGNGQD